MRIHLLTSNQQWRFGTSSVEEVAEVDDRIAEDLIAQGIARRADEPKPADDPPSDDQPPADPPSDDIPVAPEVEAAVAPEPAEDEATRESGPRRRQS